MSKLRIEQWKTEGADLFAMRAYMKAIPLMSDNELITSARWIFSIASAKVAERRKALERGTTAQVP